MRHRLSRRAIGFAVFYILFTVFLCYIGVSHNIAYNKFSCTLLDAFGDFLCVTAMLVVAIIPSAAVFLFCELSGRPIDNAPDVHWTQGNLGIDWRMFISLVLGVLLAFWFQGWSASYYNSYKVWAHEIVGCVGYGAPKDPNSAVSPSEP